MSYHVDIISNEPLAGRQYLLARVHVDDGRFRIESERPDRLQETLARIVPEIDPDQDAVAFVAALPERVDYTYMIASEPHGDTECGFERIGDARTDVTASRSAQPA